MSPLEDDLIQRARQGNPIAAEQLFASYQDRVFSYLWRMTRNRTLAEDAAQETFLRGLKGLARYRETGSFKAWLFKIAYREGLRIMKKERRFFWQLRASSESEDNAVAAPDTEGRRFLSDGTLAAGAPSDDTMIQKERQQAMEAALAKLPPNERQVVLLRIHEGLSFKEISGIMNCSVNTSLGRMHNAVKRMKKELYTEAG